MNAHDTHPMTSGGEPCTLSNARYVYIQFVWLIPAWRAWAKEFVRLARLTLQYWKQRMARRNGFEIDWEACDVQVIE